MLCYESIVDCTEKYVKQLEGLAFSKNGALACELKGAIEATIRISEVSADRWNQRVHIAMKNIMRDRDEAAELKSTVPDYISSAAILPPAQEAPKPAGVKLPTI